MEEPDSETIWWRCAYYAYLDSGAPGDLVDEDEARIRAVESLQDTVNEFLEGRLNFGTLKYRMDNASVESGGTFPPRSVSSALSDLALGVPVDDLEPAMRRAARLPEDPGEAKGSLMDLEDFIEGEVSRGHLKRPQARPERWPELAACLWHIQEPDAWPLVSARALSYLRKRGDLGPPEPAHDYAEYAALARRLSASIGADMVAVEHLLSGLGEGEIEVPDAGECFLHSLRRAGELESEGRVDEALGMFERAVSLRPRTPEALRRKALLYEGKGLIMAAIGELEALVEIEPLDLPVHRKLVALYKGQRMVREHNIEVRRFKALMEKKG